MGAHTASSEWVPQAVLGGAAAIIHSLVQAFPLSTIIEGGAYWNRTSRVRWKRAAKLP